MGLSKLEITKFVQHSLNFRLSAHTAIYSFIMDKTHKIDTTFLTETPEGVEITGHAAGPISRICAYLIDFLIRGAVLAVVAIAGIFLSEAGVGVFFIVAFLLEWFYPIYFEVFRNGQTPGKKSMGLVVLKHDQTPIDFSTSFIRNLLRAADFLPSFYIFGLLSMVSNRMFLRLGDLAAGSIVIYKQDKVDTSAVPDVTPVIPPITLTLQDQTSIISFSHRASRLSEQRKIELAEILTPITQRKGSQAVTYLQGIGSWLLGKQK